MSKEFQEKLAEAVEELAEAVGSYGTDIRYITGYMCDLSRTFEEIRGELARQNELKYAELCIRLIDPDVGPSASALKYRADMLKQGLGV